MRARSFRSDAFTPWSARVDVTVVGPFDLLTAALTDSRGPSYALAARVRERTARGRVTISLGKGKNPKRFKKLGSARIRKGGKFRFRFRHRRFGNYVMRFSYKGNATVAKGSEKRPLRFFRTFG